MYFKQHTRNLQAYRNTTVTLIGRKNVHVRGKPNLTKHSLCQWIFNEKMKFRAQIHYVYFSGHSMEVAT